MATGIIYTGVDGKPKEFAIEDGEDTNLMLGGRKSAFTVVRSRYKDEDDETRYEYWVKNTRLVFKAIVVNGEPYNGLIGHWIPSAWVIDDWVEQQSAAYKHYPQRPSGRPQKLKFDSDRTALSGYFGDYIIDGRQYRQDVSNGFNNDTVDNWTYMGGPELYPDGNFSFYGYLFKYGDNRRMCVSAEPCDTAKLKELANTSENVTVVFSGKIAEVRDWEIVSNDTPEENTYYVVVENKKGDIVDVVTTHGFGQTVNVGGTDYVVKYDMVIRPGR